MYSWNLELSWRLNKGPYITYARQRSGPNSDYCVAITLIVPLGVASTKRLSQFTHSVT